MQWHPVLFDMFTLHAIAGQPLGMSAVALQASVTHGYVGADLAAVCNEGALVATRRAIRVHQQPMQRDALPVRAQPDASAPEIISASTPPVFSDSDVPASHELATPSVAEMVVLRMEDMREGLQRVRYVTHLRHVPSSHYAHHGCVRHL